MATLVSAPREVAAAERRSTPRAKVELTAQLRDFDENVSATMLDLSEGGMAIRAAEPLRTDHILTVAFALPYTGKTIACEGKVIWSDRRGNAGVQFRDLNGDCRQVIREWLTHYAPNNEVHRA